MAPFSFLVFSTFLCGIFAVSPSGSFGDDGLYKISIEKDPRPVTTESNSSVKTVTMFNRRGLPFSCTLPAPPRPTDKHSKFNITADMIEAALTPGDKKISTSKDCITMLTNGWWHYEFCFSSKIHQFHIEGDKIAQPTISLGTFSHNFNWSQVSEQEATKKVDRAHIQYFINGSDCDVTGKKRSTRVKLYCSANTPHRAKDYIVKVDEPESCVYEVTVLTSRVCQIDYFNKQSESVGKIICSPVSRPVGTLRVIESTTGDPIANDEDDEDDEEEEVGKTKPSSTVQAAEDVKQKVPAKSDPSPASPGKKQPSKVPSRTLSAKHKAFLEKLRAPPKSPARTFHDVLAEMSPIHRRMREIEKIIFQQLTGEANAGQIAILEVQPGDDLPGAAGIQEVLDQMSADHVAKFQAILEQAVAGQYAPLLREQEAVYVQEDNYNMEEQEETAYEEEEHEEDDFHRIEFLV